MGKQVLDCSHRRKGCFHGSAFSCGTQTLLTMCWVEQKKAGSPGKLGSSKFPIPMLFHLRRCAPIHYFLQIEFPLLTSETLKFRKSEFSDPSYWWFISLQSVLDTSMLPWGERGIEQLLQRFHSLFAKNHMDKKNCQFWKVKHFESEFRDLWAQEG